MALYLLNSEGGTFLVRAKNGTAAMILAECDIDETVCVRVAEAGPEEVLIEVQEGKSTHRFLDEKPDTARPAKRRKPKQKFLSDKPE